MELLSEYIIRKNVRVEVIDGPTFEDHDETGRVWMHEEYKIRVFCEGRKADFKWMQGLAVRNTPEEMPLDVFSSLLLDASSFRNFDTLEDMANEYAYDLEDEKERENTQKLWDALAEETPKIIELVGGEEELDYLIYSVEDDS